MDIRKATIMDLDYITKTISEYYKDLNTKISLEYYQSSIEKLTPYIKERLSEWESIQIFHSRRLRRKNLNAKSIYRVVKKVWDFALYRQQRRKYMDSVRLLNIITSKGRTSYFNSNSRIWKIHRWKITEYEHKKTSNKLDHLTKPQKKN